MLFPFHEFFGGVTNLVGGWLAARLGLNVTMHLGMGLQFVGLRGALIVLAALLSFKLPEVDESEPGRREAPRGV